MPETTVTPHAAAPALLEHSTGRWLAGLANREQYDAGNLYVDVLFPSTDTITQLFRSKIVCPRRKGEYHQDGWDGRSNPRYSFVEPCGCKWTTDGAARLSTCSAGFDSAIHKAVTS